MSTKARIVKGATVEWGTDGVAYTSVPECKSAPVPDLDPEYLEVTNLDSPGNAKEYIPGLEEPGTSVIECNHSSDLYAQALSYKSAKTKVYFKVTTPIENGFTTGDEYVYQAYVSPRMVQGAPGDVMMMQLALQFTGTTAFTQGTAA